MRAIAILGLVRRLLTYEAAEDPNQGSLIEAAGRVTDKLRAHLTKRIGQEGFRTLLARALALTVSQFPYLDAVRVGADGVLVGLRLAAGVGSQQTGDDGTRPDAVDGAVALVAHLLALLVTFIGEDLTLRILSTVWPGFALTELASDDTTGRENERP